MGVSTIYFSITFTYPRRLGLFLLLPPGVAPPPTPLDLPFGGGLLSVNDNKSSNPEAVAKLLCGLFIDGVGLVLSLLILDGGADAGIGVDIPPVVVVDKSPPGIGVGLGVTIGGGPLLLLLFVVVETGLGFFFIDGGGGGGRLACNCSSNGLLLSIQRFNFSS